MYSVSPSKTTSWEFSAGGSPHARVETSPASAALRASSGPQKASASTVTITTCLPCSNAASACSTAAIGLPVASITMSIPGCATSARQSSPRCVLFCFNATSSEAAENVSAFQPTRVRFSLAFAGARSAMPTRWIPGVFGTCARYIAANLPAPISPIRSGLSLRSWSLAYRFMLSPRPGRGACRWPGIRVPHRWAAIAARSNAHDARASSARTRRIPLPSLRKAHAAAHTRVRLRTRATSTWSRRRHDPGRCGTLHIPDRAWRSFAANEKNGVCPHLSSLENALQLLRRRAVLPGERDVVVLEQAIVGQDLDRGEVAVRDVTRALEAPDVVRDRAQRQIDADAVPRREVRGRGVHQAAVEQDHRSRRALRRDDAAALDQLADAVVVDHPERIAGGRRVVLRVEHAELVAAGDEHQRAVVLGHLVEEDRDVHRARFRHLVVGAPGAVVLVPLPDVAVERLLAVDLELVHVDVFAVDLPDRLDHARMARELGERSAVEMRREVGAHHVAGLLAHVLGPALLVERRHFVGQRLDFCRSEKRREEEIALAVELGNLCRRKLH